MFFLKWIIKPGTKYRNVYIMRSTSLHLNLKIEFPKKKKKQLLHPIILIQRKTTFYYLAETTVIRFLNHWHSILKKNLENCYWERKQVFHLGFIFASWTHLWWDFANHVLKSGSISVHTWFPRLKFHVLTLVMAEVAVATAPNTCRVKYLVHLCMSFWSYHLM